MFASVPGTNLY